MSENKNIFLLRNLTDVIIDVRQAIKDYFVSHIQEIREGQISYEMFQVIIFLGNLEKTNQQEIANAIQKRKASLTPLIDNLVKAGLVTRTEDSTDRRNKIIELTKEGNDYYQEILPIINQFYVAFKGELPEERITGVINTLKILRSQI